MSRPDTESLIIIRFLILLVFSLTLNPFSTSAWADPIRIYQVEPFDFIYPNTEFKSAPIESVSISMARNEFEPLTFAILPERDFGNISIEINDLRDKKNNKIKKQNIDVRVVKVWNQSGTNWSTAKDSKDVLVPELLLKDDTVEIIDSWKGDIYVPPAFPIRFKTSLHKGEVKQIWITVKTEPGQNPPGLYNGTIKILSESKVIKTISLNISVLPIILPEPGKRLFIYFLGRVNTDNPMYVERNEYVSQLDDIRDHGFNGITIYGSNFEEVKEAVDRVAKVGYKGVVIRDWQLNSSDSVAQIKDYCSKKNLEVYFYGIDEPEGDEKLKKHIARSKLIHEGGGKVVTAIINKKIDDLLNERGSKAYQSFPERTYEPLDWENINLRQFKNNEDMQKGRSKKKHEIETYYWQIMQENPTMHRLYSGFYLWKSGLDGIFPYCYQEFPKISPYNGGDRRPQQGSNRDSRVFNVTYPGKEGPVPTLQWEAIREGIDDLKYLTRLKELSKNRTDLARKQEEILVDFNYVGVDNTGKPVMNAEKFSAARKKIIDIILQLEGLKK